MGEEKNGVPNGEMPPQEESSKILLNEGAEPKPEVQVANEAKIDIPAEEEFRGLSKEELMQYAKEPFWVRLRIFLMFVFWAAWVAMLALAILIIIQAPRCEPPPTITWMQEGAMLQVDPDYINPSDAVSLVSTLGLGSFYIPSLISSHDYFKLNPDYVSEKVMAILEAFSTESVHGVTDFVPNPVESYHAWVQDPQYSSLITQPDRMLNFSSDDLSPALQKVFMFWNSTYNITGFSIAAGDSDAHPELHNLTLSLNDAFQDQIVIDEGRVDISDIINELDIPGKFQNFLESNIDNNGTWPYYKFTPVTENHRPASKAQMPGVAMSLMMSAATPMFGISNNNISAFIGSVGEVVTACSKLRSKDAIKFGDTYFVNSTDNTVAFTRTQKGTPGYAVAANLGAKDVVLNFGTIKVVPDFGSVVYNMTSGATDENTKIDMKTVSVEAHGGLIIQFVAQYD